MTNEKCAENVQLKELQNLYSRPLTAQEADFAAQHLSLVRWFLHEQGLDESEWFDVVIFRYLLSVKRWHSQPHLKAYSFSTIAVKAMHSAVSGERRKQMRRVETVSLNTTRSGRLYCRLSIKGREPCSCTDKTVI